MIMNSKPPKFFVQFMKYVIRFFHKKICSMLVHNFGIFLCPLATAYFEAKNKRDNTSKDKSQEVAEKKLEQFIASVLFQIVEKNDQKSIFERFDELFVIGCEDSLSFP